MEKHYTNGTDTIVWKPDLCIHSGNCFGNLPEVFNPRINPWVKPENASSVELLAVVRACPSGALSVLGDKAEDSTSADTGSQDKSAGKQVSKQPGTVTVKVTKGGPYMISGEITVKHHDGTVSERTSVTALCRCGQSRKKPFCDGSHVKSELDKTEDI